MSIRVEVKQLYLKTPFGIVPVSTSGINNSVFQNEESFLKLQAISFSFHHIVLDRRSVWQRIKMLFQKKKLHYKPDLIKIKFSGSMNLQNGEIFSTADTEGGNYAYEVLGYDLVSEVTRTNVSLRDRGMLIEVEDNKNGIGRNVKISNGRKNANKSKAPKTHGPQARKNSLAYRVRSSK